LIEAESKPKHVGLIRINKNQYEFEPIYIKQRPFFYKQITLSEFIGTSNEDALNTDLMIDDEAA